MDAAKAGRTRYLIESPCPTCGGFERFTSNGNCTECARRATADRHAAIREALKNAKAEQVDP